jgi:microcin C transport system substrate-binding protein
VDEHSNAGEKYMTNTQRHFHTRSLAAVASLRCIALSLLSLFLAAALSVASNAAAQARLHGPLHALTLGGTPKYPKGFKHFAYADPAARKGGTLVLSAPGGFDTLNPFTLKGRSPLLLGGLVFEPLTDNSLDEPFSEYGLLAESMEVAPDQLSLVYRLNPNARFSDGSPVKAEDVVFSFTILRSEAAQPFYRFYYQDIAAVEAVDARTVRLKFARKNPELALIAGQLPILPKHIYGTKEFGEGFVRQALGSGPYRVKDFDFGKYIRYERNPNHWSAKLGVNVGRYNFDEILVKYYRDPNVELEALKAGDFDFLSVTSSKQWAVDMAGEKWAKGWIVKESLSHSNNEGMQGFAFNLRRPVFADRRVRKALVVAFDFEWTNKNLFYGQYIASDSYFANSDLAAKGLPSLEELKLLNPFKGQLPPEVFTEPLRPVGVGLADMRDRLRESLRLLREAGWEVRDGTMTEMKTGRPLRFTITLASPLFQRIVEPYLNNLKRIGVIADMKVVDDSVYQRMVDDRAFDMIVHRVPQSQSPGNEQRDFWHSESASQQASRNVIGIRNPAVDALVEAIIQAPDRKALVIATHALDRVLWHEYYMVPQWYINYHRVAYWNKFSRPKTLPLYYTPISFLMYWWVDPAKNKALEAAVKSGSALK